MTCISAPSPPHSSSSPFRILALGIVYCTAVSALSDDRVFDGSGPPSWNLSLTLQYFFLYPFATFFVLSRIRHTPSSRAHFAHSHCRAVQPSATHHNSFCLLLRNRYSLTLLRCWSTCLVFTTGQFFLIWQLSRLASYRHMLSTDRSYSDIGTGQRLRPPHSHSS